MRFGAFGNIKCVGGEKYFNVAMQKKLLDLQNGIIIGFRTQDGGISEKAKFVILLRGVIVYRA